MGATALPPANERTLAARIGAFSLHAAGLTNTKPARDASPGSLLYWLSRVDPDSRLSEPERLRRAECARRAHFSKLALLSAQSRRKANGRGRRR